MKKNYRVSLLVVILAIVSLSTYANGFLTASREVKNSNKLLLINEKKISRTISNKNNRILGVDLQGGNVENYGKHWFPQCTSYLEIPEAKMVRLI